MAVCGTTIANSRFLQINASISLVWYRNHEFIIYFCETKLKGIKKTVKILGFSIAGIILFFAILLLLLHNNRVQNFIAQKVTSELSARLHAKISVGRIDYQFFDAISISNLYVGDQQEDTLLFARSTSARFSLWKILQGKVKITAFEFDRLHANLVVDSLGHTNLDFILQALKKKEPADTASNVVFSVGRLKLSNSSFDFTNHQSDAIVPPGVFNAGEMQFKDINANISVDVFSKDTLSAEIRSFSATEKSGLVVKDFSTQITGSGKGALLPYINIELPNSFVKLENIEVKYDNLADLKNFFQKIRLNAPIETSRVALADLSAFVPELKNTRGAATFSGVVSGRLSSLHFRQMNIKYGKSFEMNADLDISGLPNVSDAFIYGQVNELKVEKSDLQDFISDVTRKPFVLPKELNQLGVVRYKGNISGFLSNLVAYGNLNTNLGSISTDILIQLENHLKDLKYNGTLKTKGFELGKLLVNKQFGRIVFEVNTNGSKKMNAPLQGTLKASVSELLFNSYTYRDILFNGKYDGSGFDGKVDLQDDNINAHFNGVIDLTQKLPVFVFDLKVKNTDLHALHLMKNFQGAKLSFNGRTNMVGNSLDNINGFVSFDSIAFTNRDKTLYVDKMQFVSRVEQNITHFLVNSDFINGSLSGNFKYGTLGETVSGFLRDYLPSLATGNIPNHNPSHIDVDLKIANTEAISDVFGLPYKIEGVSTINGFVDEKTKRIDITGNIPKISSSKRVLENISLHCENKDNELQLTSRAQFDEKDGKTSFYLLASAAQDSIDTQLGWQNTQKITNAGEIQAVAKLRNENGKMAARLSILPTQVIIADSVWDIHRSYVDLNADSSIVVHNFRFDNERQYVHINGTAANNQTDSMVVDMNGLNVDFLLRQLLKLKGVSIGGYASGSVKLTNLLAYPIYQADIEVKNVSLNHKHISDAHLYSTWDKINKKVLVNGVFVNGTDTAAVAGGAYFPKTDSLDFVIDARKIGIEFLTPYLEGVVQGIQGYGSGKVHMYGPSKTLGFAGDVYVDHGQVSVGVLKTSYLFNDTVHLTRKSIEFKNITIYDQERNPGTLSGKLTHDGVFRNMNYNLNLRGRNLLALNTHAEDNEYFFGKAYANGTVRIFGNEKEANIVVNAVSQPQTKCYVQMDGASTASDNSFINFKNSKVKQGKDTVVKPAASSFNVKVDLRLDVTPDADMELIVDSKGGDVIRGRGNGSLRVEFDTFSDIKLFGTYVIDNGYYLFTMQNVFRKEFKIDQGSSIAWSGNPFKALVNIRALYSVTVSLKDLASSQLGENMRSTVPVNCVLKLTDDLMKPTVKFDIELPQSDEGVKQLVSNIVNTDEMMNRQILYLLVFNKFYTPDYMRTNTTNTNIASNEGVSLLSSTLSAQLNNWLKPIVSNVTFGVGFQKSTQTNGGWETQAQILYQPNNRIIVNGNFGYRNDLISTTTNNRIIGDVDLEYLLSESGNLRFKAYNHTVDRYYLGAAKLSQGLGFVYKEDFASYDDLFKYYWHLLSGNNKKKAGNETKK
ncbi:MAG TPA: translocation/assembly module TamB domain-containing protein [Paludibacter sp.]|nr:translocation/assembly module TamB domain-containing protein [Paludibacter sp.]